MACGTNRNAMTSTNTTPPPLPLPICPESRSAPSRHPSPDRGRRRPFVAKVKLVAFHLLAAEIHARRKREANNSNAEGLDQDNTSNGNNMRNTQQKIRYAQVESSERKDHQC